MIVEKDIPDEVLEKFHNLVSAIIYLEKRRDEKGLKNAINKVIEMIRDENIIDVKMFTIWFNRMFKQNVYIEEIEKINNLSEAQYMLTEIADKILERGKIEERIELAKKMKEEGLNIALIVKITGLSKEEIQKL